MVNINVRAKQEALIILDGQEVSASGTLTEYQLQSWC